MCSRSTAMIVHRPPSDGASEEKYDPSKAPESPELKVDETVVEVKDDDGALLDPAVRPTAEKNLVRKLDCFIAPVMMLLMLISYLDRGNIGFAATQGMSVDIRLKGSELNACFD